VLFLSRWLPYPPDNGSKIRVFNILRQLGRDFEISLVTLSDATSEVEGRAYAALSAFCSRVQVMPHRAYRPTSTRALVGVLSRQPRFLVDTYQAEVAEAICQEARRFRPQVVIASQIDMLPYALELPDTPLILEELELAVHFDATRKSLRRRLTLLKLTSYLRNALPRLAACTVVSNQEEALLERVAPGYQRVRVVPNGVDLTDYEADYGWVEPNSLIFSGSITYAPNEDAMRFFLDDIYPRVLREIDAAHLRITGANSAPQRPLPVLVGVELTGHVSDVRPLIACSTAAIVPLRRGGGTRLKILEAMALRTPVVSTSKGAEGLAVTAGENILVADTPATFADCVVHLLRTPELRARVSRAGRRLVEDRYDWSRIGSGLAALVDQVASA
jgi:glycosyltransferase involved in cell wall biosynthesis